eukprot:m.127065 g.127065  ORF g.127065 m.127065 type:complete len:313 (+) comp12998_c0_seq3:135-1073(+)
MCECISSCGDFPSVFIYSYFCLFGCLFVLRLLIFFVFLFKTALSGFDSQLVREKCELAKKFGFFLRRFTSLNHLVSSMRNVVKSATIVKAMTDDLSSIDFISIHKQCATVVPCTQATVESFYKDVNENLKSQLGVSGWVEWLHGKMWNACSSGATDSEKLKKARDFVKIWSLYGSLLLRDLTLRSSTSFGSFHLCRLVLSELLAFIIERVHVVGIACLKPGNISLAIHPGVDYDNCLRPSIVPQPQLQPQSQQLLMQQPQLQQSGYPAPPQNLPSYSLSHQQQQPQQQGVMSAMAPTRPTTAIETSKSAVRF